MKSKGDDRFKYESTDGALPVFAAKHTAKFNLFSNVINRSSYDIPSVHETPFMTVRNSTVVDPFEGALPSPVRPSSSMRKRPVRP